MTGLVASLAAVALLLAIAIVFWSRGRRGEPEIDIGAEMAALAQRAIAEAQRTYGVTLDATPASIEQVEAILARLHETHRAAAFRGTELHTEARVWGAYIGETARQMGAGGWQRHSAVMGKNTSPFVHTNGDESYPVAWAFQRIAGGPDENVWLKFQATFLGRRRKRVDLAALFNEATADSPSNPPQH